MSTDPDPHPIAAEDFLPIDDSMDFESVDLWLPPLDSPESSPQLPQQLPQQLQPQQQQQQQQQQQPPIGAVHIDAQQQYVSTPSEAVHLSPLTLPARSPSHSLPQILRMLAVPNQFLTVLQGSSSYMLASATGQLPQVANKPTLCMAGLQRLTAIASKFQQKTTVFVRSAPVHAAANLLDMAKRLMPSREQKTIDAAVLWAALCKYPHEEHRLYRAKHFAGAAGVSNSTLSIASNKLLNDVEFTTALHMMMYSQWVAAGDSEMLLSSEPEPASRGTKRGREEDALASSPAEQVAFDAASLAEDAVFFPMKKKIHVDGSQLADEHTGIQVPAYSCQPTSGQLLLVMLTRHCKDYLILQTTYVILLDANCATA